MINGVNRVDACPYADIRVSPICVIHDFAQIVIGHRYIEVPLILGCMGCDKKGGENRDLKVPENFTF